MAISCRVTRGDLTESIHVAFAVAVDENGQIFFSSGDPNYLTCIRSSLKPFQAAASIKAGAVDSVNFSNEEIALMCASHQGEQVHTNTAISMLKKMDLNIAKRKLKRGKLKLKRAHGKDMLARAS